VPATVAASAIARGVEVRGRRRRAGAPVASTRRCRTEGALDKIAVSAYVGVAFAVFRECARSVTRACCTVGANAEREGAMENQFIESMFRWVHVLAGITWIGLLYFFNFVNSGFAPTMDADTKTKVVPELMPRALYWFRWGAAFTWITGVFLLMLVYYHSGLVFESGTWGPASFVMLAVVFLGFLVYDFLYSSILKDPTTGFVAGWFLATVVVFLLDYVAGFSYRGYAIHLGAMFGTAMAFNVWFRIWPAQQKIIAAVKQGQAPDASLAALAATRSKHNTYMSVPLVFMMISQHAIWAAHPIWLSLVVLVGFAAVYWLYTKAAQVKGF
jgi:uncharacterized membrane protein